MDGQLLVRVYNFGLGDCIYLRVPDKQRNVHILIDCGNKFGSLALLGERIADLKNDLDTTEDGEKRLDLLVVSHPHEDHHKGFEEAFFNDIQIYRIWLSPTFDRENPQAKGFYSLQDAAVRAVNALNSLSPDALGEMQDEVAELLSLSKSEALTMLNTTLPERNGIRPLYVTANTPAKQLKIFTDPAIKLRVLGPMSDIDRFYLGGDGLMTITNEFTPAAVAEGYQAIFRDTRDIKTMLPKNIASLDFKLLRSRIHANALSVAAVVGHAVNNLSVVLLLEWRGHRLLFSGDAEWNDAHDGAVTAGSSNGSWNVMWQERRSALSKPLSFYKIGHHGSENAPPWRPPDPKTGKEHPINQIINKLLPIPAPGKAPTAYAIASTQRTARWPSIPNAPLLTEIGKRVANIRSTYVEPPSAKAVPDYTSQPQRTDLESQVTGMPSSYIEIYFDPLK